MRKLVLTGAMLTALAPALVAYTPSAFATILNNVGCEDGGCTVPEIDTGAGLLALALVGGLVAVARERSRR